MTNVHIKICNFKHIIFKRRFIQYITIHDALFSQNDTSYSTHFKTTVTLMLYRKMLLVVMCDKNEIHIFICSRSFAEALQKVGAKAELVLYDGKSHTDLFLQVSDHVEWC